MNFRKIFLIGLRATGKTSVGQLLAERLDMPFYDLDEVIVNTAGKQIKQIVEEGGWEAFRSLERTALANFFSQDTSFVLACGGGAVLHEDVWISNRQGDHRDHVVVWLKAGVDEMLKRIVGDSNTDSQRPALTSGLAMRDEIEAVMKQRKSLYERFSDMEINTDSVSINQIVEVLLKDLEEIV